MALKNVLPHVASIIAATSRTRGEKSERSSVSSRVGAGTASNAIGAISYAAPGTGKCGHGRACRRSGAEAISTGADVFSEAVVGNEGSE